MKQEEEEVKGGGERKERSSTEERTVEIAMGKLCNLEERIIAGHGKVDIHQMKEEH